MNEIKDQNSNTSAQSSSDLADEQITLPLHLQLL